VTRTSLSSQKLKGQGHQAALLTAVLARQAAAAVGVRTCWQWKTADTLPSARRREVLQRPRGRRGAGAYRGARPPTACYYYETINFMSSCLIVCIQLFSSFSLGRMSALFISLFVLALVVLFYYVIALYIHSVPELNSVNK